jgi:type III secretion protein T
METAFLGVESLVNAGENIKGIMMLMVLCSARIYVALLVMPVSNDSILKGVTRNGLALSFGIFLAFGQPINVLQAMPTLSLLTLIAKESIIGLLLGYAVSVVFWTAEGVGVLIDNQAGYNNVQQTNPLSGEQSTPVGNMLSQLAISCFYMLGGMMAFASLIFESFKWWPLQSTLPQWTLLLERFVAVHTESITTAVITIASPVVMVLLLIDLGIGLIAKTADKLEPNNLGQPIKGAVAMLMLVMLVSVFFEQVRPQLALHTIGKQLEVWTKPHPAKPQTPKAQ